MTGTRAKRQPGDVRVNSRRYGLLADIALIGLDRTGTISVGSQRRLQWGAASIDASKDEPPIDEELHTTFKCTLTAQVYTNHKKGEH